MHILESALYSEDLEGARGFYVGVLGLPEISFDPDRHLFLRCDRGVLILFKASRTRIPDSVVPPHGCEGPGHLAFAASVEEIEAWRSRLEKAGVPIIEEIDWPNGARSIYFTDPTGNVLEFATPNLWGF